MALFVAVPLLDNAPEKVNPKALVFKALMDQTFGKSSGIFRYGR